MFQLGTLVVLCGLLIPNSGSPLGILQNLDLYVESDWSEVKARLLEALSSVAFDRLTDLLSQKGVGLEIKDLKILDLKHDQSSNGDEMILKVPLVLDAVLSLPLPDSTPDVSVSMEMLSSLAVQKDAKIGHNVLVMKECSTSRDKISIDLLNICVSVPSACEDVNTTFTCRWEAVGELKDIMDSACPELLAAVGKILQ
ncbi:BPI fold-containing family A member 2-like [Mus pahari]|uniref:BPI fold-containing family A member 2-like n=1 Tax=Mus pahari TaxID=10093 RepID=UPI000A310021|nr:BPI fold-containing family A member 2-like [Mus pahari]